MRIIAGRWRGRRLTAPVGEAVRPTTDRTKEALFNIIGPKIAGCQVLDLCCGAGGLGLEALSRGAASVVFVDRAPSSLAATRANLALCGAESSGYRLECAEALAWLQRWSGPQKGPWMLLCDPPYAATTAAAVIGWLDGDERPEGLLLAAVEYGADTPEIPELTAGWHGRRYGGSRLAVYQTNV